MDSSELFGRYQELQRYVGWSPEDAVRVQSLSPLLQPHLTALVEDFYAEIDRHPAARRVITGGPQQVARLKGSLTAWLQDLLAGPYDEHYVARRWRVGLRHVEIGLDQVFTNVALSRLRRGLVLAIDQDWSGDLQALLERRRSLNTLLDLDLAIIEDAYQSEYLARQQRSERLAAIGQVAGGVAHELRNPLNVIKTSAYYLLNARNPQPEKVNEHLQRIERHVGLADNVITALSSFAKLPLPNVNPFAIGECVREALELSPVSDGIHVVVDCPVTLPPVMADREQIRIVLGNLIRNARDAMPAGGRLAVQAKQVGNALELAVSDEGVGIPPDNLARIMEPLFSTKARGLGLGLAISRAILDKNGGLFRVASEPDKGTTVTIVLPTVSQPE